MHLKFVAASAVGAALLAGTLPGLAVAHEEGRVERDVQIIMRGEGPGMGRGPMTVDTNADGFVSRDEARTAAEALFDRRDANDDAKLDAADRQAGRQRREVREERTVIIDGDGQNKTVEIERRGPPGRGGDGPRPPRPPHPPMMGLMLMDMAEADANRDGSVSKAEFVGYQLRFFDAGDANGDGKIAVPPPPPEPPQPPEAPDLPEPPAPPKR